MYALAETPIHLQTQVNTSRHKKTQINTQVNPIQSTACNFYYLEEIASYSSHKLYFFAATMAVEREGRLLDLFSRLAFAAKDGRNQDATL